MSLYQKQLFGTDGFVILTEGKVPGHLTRLDDKGAFPREFARLFTAAPDLVKALERVIEAAERALGDHIAPHDCFATGLCMGNPIADLIVCPGCVQQNEIARARAAISRALPGGEGK